MWFPKSGLHNNLGVQWLNYHSWWIAITTKSGHHTILSSTSDLVNIIHVSTSHVVISTVMSGDQTFVSLWSWGGGGRLGEPGEALFFNVYVPHRFSKVGCTLVTDFSFIFANKFSPKLVSWEVKFCQNQRKLDPKMHFFYMEKGRHRNCMTLVLIYLYTSDMCIPPWL